MRKEGSWRRGEGEGREEDKCRKGGRFMEVRREVRRVHVGEEGGEERGGFMEVRDEREDGSRVREGRTGRK
jgi:hypothetical protein